MLLNNLASKKAYQMGRTKTLPCIQSDTIQLFFIILYRMSKFTNTPKGCHAEGTYTYVDSYNFDPYLQALGVPWYLRKLASFAKPSITITRLNDGFER